MTRNSMRLAYGGRIDRGRVLQFTFNGRIFYGFEGDTLASALIANGVILTARSFRYHRPRGIFSSGVEECHALLAVGTKNRVDANVRATQEPLFDGLVATAQSGWPGIRFDVGAALGWLTRILPAGFYYKTFIWPRWSLYEGFIRRIANNAPVSPTGDPDVYDKQHVHCDLLIIGAGPAGLAAASAAARSGLRILLVDSQREAGGSLLGCAAEIDGQAGATWAEAAVARLSGMPNVTLLSRCMLVAAWDHNLFTGVQEQPRAAENKVQERLWKIRARKTLLASGAFERPLVFPNNDRPGIMLAGAAREYAQRYAALPGKRAVFVTNNDSAYLVALDLQACGTDIVAIVDVRRKPADELLNMARAATIEVFSYHAVTNTHGYLRLRSVEIQALQSNARQRIDCDLLCVSGGRDPVLHLLSQAGGKLQYSEELACFLPRREQDTTTSDIVAAGAANGRFGVAAALRDGHERGIELANQLAVSELNITTPPFADHRPASPRVSAHWRGDTDGGKRQWVDHLHDVTVTDIEIAAREGFTSVEHLKRYTTTGMAPDQGKTSNINALGILGKATDRAPHAVGTTTFRPPYTPVRLGVLAGRETGERSWPMRRLPLHDWHIAAGGVLEDHSGWLRAACYPRATETEEDAIRREVTATRKHVALLDSSSLGKIEVGGPDAARFLDRIYINNVETLGTGRVRYGIMLRDDGIIADDGVFARLDDELFLVSASSAGTAEVVIALEEWLQTEWPELDVLIHNATSQWATITVTGPRSRDVIGSLLVDTDLGADALPHMSVRQGDTSGMPYRLMRVSFTGEMSFELSLPADNAMAVWEKLMRAGEPYGIAALGMEALDVLRTEKGFAEVGVDTDSSTSPLDIGWRRVIENKSADFIGKRSLSLPAFTRVDRLQLVGLRPVQKTHFVPVGSHLIDTKKQDPIGHITSSCLSPTLHESIAMAMLESGHERLGETVVIDIDGEGVEAAIVPLCFYDPQGERLRS